MKFTAFFTLFALIVVINGCKKNSVCVEGTVRDYTGLDGCRMMIDLKNGDRLQPISLPVGVVLIANRKVCISYKEKPAFNTCMAGTTVEITSLTYKD